MDNETIERLLVGSIDMHVHFAPGTDRPRCVDAVQAATEARDMGMRGIVLKSHDYTTAPLAYNLRRLIKGIEIFGALSLDDPVGGLNVAAVEASAKMGAKIVWLPTLSSANDRRMKGLSGGLTVLDQRGKLVPEMREILQMIKAYDMVLATGHLSAEEVFAVVAEARALKLPKIVVTHPEVRHLGCVLNSQQMRELADMGAYIEHCFCGTMPGSHRLDPMDIIEQIGKVGPDRTVLSTDLGQPQNPKPAEGMRVMIGTYLKCGLVETELDIMIKKNPAKLLGLE
ncbi:MAG: hypothetical protein HYX92_15905 [Chloroflexi bacterium]|nr:hypothetical protein [Chloroflexota bacterium]